MKWGSRALGKPVTNGKSINKLIELERRKSARVVMCSRNVCLCVCVFSKAIDGFVAMHGNTSERDIGCLMIAANADVASVTRSELWFSQHTKYWARCCMRMFQMRSECESSSAANYLLWPLTKDEHTLCNIVAKPNMHFARVSWLVSVGWLSFFSLLLLIQFLWYYIANDHCVFNVAIFLLLQFFSCSFYVCRFAVVNTL